MTVEGFVPANIPLSGQGVRPGGMPNIGGGNFLSSLQENPEVLALALDMLGKGIAPNNPFAGIGSTLAQSSLAGKQAEDIAKKDEEFNKLLLSALGGKQLTPNGMEGPTSINVTNAGNGLQATVKSDLGSLNTTPTGTGIQTTPNTKSTPTFASNPPTGLLPQGPSETDQLIKSLGGYPLLQ